VAVEGHRIPEGVDRDVVLVTINRCNPACVIQSFSTRIASIEAVLRRFFGTTTRIPTSLVLFFDTKTLDLG
jgi:hypothetical protein